MKKLTLILTLFCTLFAVVPRQAATKKKTENPKYNVKGKVKTWTQLKYEIKTVFGEVKKTLSEKIIYKHDTTGNRIESASYNADGELSVTSWFLNSMHAFSKQEKPAQRPAFFIQAGWKLELEALPGERRSRRSSDRSSIRRQVPGNYSLSTILLFAKRHLSLQ